MSSILFILVGYLVSWTPYAIVALYAAFIGDLPPLAGTVPAMFAKSSLLWTSVLFIFSNKQVRAKIMADFLKVQPQVVEISMSRSKNFVFKFT